jgi:glycosyltransferase involved in cell wall biosynthesis
LIAGYFSPLPPVKSGIADYSAALLPELRKFGVVEIAPDQYDAGLYQLGNNRLHREAYARALVKPGVAVIHDALLNHFFLSTLSEDEYVAEFVYNYGEWCRAEARTLWRERAVSGADPRYFARPMLKRIAESSKAVIVHNPAARRRVLEHAPGARVVEIPHFYIPLEKPEAAAVLAFRGRARYLFGVFGYLRESKRLYPILKAFARLRRVDPGVELLIAGEFHSADSEKCLEPLLQGAGVRRIGHMRDATFALATEAVDCCINLRYPSAGETSGIGVRLMGMGKPVILTDGDENASLRDYSYLSVEPGIREEAHLFELLCLLAGSPEVGRAVGERAAEHILRYHSMRAAAEQYWKTLCDVCS